MKIVYITEWFSENMGYIENCLPFSMRKLGHEVHIISTTSNVYANQTALYKKTYESFLGAPFTPVGKKTLGNGVTLHRLDFYRIPGFKSKYVMRGLGRLIKEIQPDIVHLFEPFSLFHLPVLRYKSRFNYRIFTAQHIMLSVFPLDKKWDKGVSIEKIVWYLTSKLPGAYTAKHVEYCYPTTPDAAFIAKKYFSVPDAQCKLAPLGVDTDTFHPVASAEDENARQILRGSLGYTDEDIVCIYTGRFSDGKDPLILALAIDILAARDPRFKGLFIGEGEQLGAIERCKNCKVIKFLLHQELPPYYRAADIGVWPTQESTSMIDAAAAGLPLVVNHTIKATERIEGNGITYKLGDAEDLAQQLLTLADASIREKMGKLGSDKARRLFSWDKIALERQEDYKLGFRDSKA